MVKLWTIAWKEIYIRFTDRNLLLIMIATPLAISSIVGLAFGGLGGGDTPIRDIPLLLVNHDQGGQFGVNYGEVYASLLVPEAGSAGPEIAPLPDCPLAEREAGSQGGSQVDLLDLTEAEILDVNTAQTLIEPDLIPDTKADPSSPSYLDSAARALVERGDYAAAIIVPPDFTQRLTTTPGDQNLERVEVSVYADPNRPVSAGIIQGIAAGITNQIATGSIAVNTTFSELEARLGGTALASIAGSMDFQEAFACAFSPASNTIQIDKRNVENAPQENRAALILVSAGSAQAMFFALFTAQFGVFSMYNERRNWTLQRLIISPTRRGLILGGKLVGVFASVLFQLVTLFLALTLVGSLMQGEPTLIWGSRPLLIAVVLISASLGVSGLGMLMAGIVKSPESAQVFSSVLNMALAVLGGAFGFALPEEISQLSLIYWGRDAFDTLAGGGGDVWLNVVVLAAQGVVMFVIGILLFNRHFENV